MGANGSLPIGRVADDWTAVGSRASHASKASPMAIVAVITRTPRIEFPWGTPKALIERLSGRGYQKVTREKEIQRH